MTESKVLEGHCAGEVKGCFQMHAKVSVNVNVRQSPTADTDFLSCK